MIKVLYISIALILLGILNRLMDIPGKGILVIFGLTGIIVFFTRELVKESVRKANSVLKNSLKILIILTSIILFSKYLYYDFGDYLGLVIIPVFVIAVIVYLLKEPNKSMSLTSSSVFYLVLNIPVLFIYHSEGPRNYIPKEWFDRFNVESVHSYTVPAKYRFKTNKVKKLSNKGDKYQNLGLYKEAIKSYRNALKLEPENPMIYLSLAEPYAKINEIEKSVILLDSAILIDSSVAVIYNNRGGLKYMLESYDEAIQDFEKSLKIDSTQKLPYFNIAVSYLEKKNYLQFCKYIKLADLNGVNISDDLYEIRDKYCN